MFPRSPRLVFLGFASANEPLEQLGTFPAALQELDFQKDPRIPEGGAAWSPFQGSRSSLEPIPGGSGSAWNPFPAFRMILEPIPVIRDQPGAHS